MTVNLEELKNQERKERLVARKLRIKKIQEKWEPIIANLKKIELFYSEFSNQNLPELKLLIHSLQTDFKGYNNTMGFVEFSKNVLEAESLKETEKSFLKLKEEVIKAAIINQYFRDMDMTLCRKINNFFKDCDTGGSYLTPLLFSFDAYSPINDAQHLKKLIYLIKLNSNLDIIQRAFDELFSHCISVYKSPHYKPPKPTISSLLTFSNEDEEAEIMRSFREGEQDRFGY